MLRDQQCNRWRTLVVEEEVELLAVRVRRDPVVFRNSRTELVVVVHEEQRASKLGGCREEAEEEDLRSDLWEVVEDEDVHAMVVVVVEAEGAHTSKMDTSCCNSHLEVRGEDIELLLPCTFLLFAR